MSARQFEVRVWTPSGVVPVVVTANNQQEAHALVSGMYAALIANDPRYSVADYVTPL